jgi:hypothetical protein
VKARAPNNLRIWLLDTETAEISDLAALNDGNRSAGHTELVMALDT